jgi:hypothetical protein
MSFIVPFLLDEDATDPITPAPILSPSWVTGPAAFGTAAPAIIPAPILSRARVTGPQAPLDTATARPITPAPILSRGRVTGPWLPRPAADPKRSRAIDVAGFPDTTVVGCTPQINGPGAGRFTMAPTQAAPVLRQLIGFDVRGRRQFTGRTSSVTIPQVVAGEEAEQLPDVVVEGLLAEFTEALVLPDFGAQDLRRLGAPTQDTRLFDWTMNGLGVDSPDGVPRPNIIDSVGVAGRYGESPGFGTIGELFPLPDVWPDPYAKWMWVADPARRHQPAGWCHFREPFGIPGSTRIQVWCCAYDYAEVFMDGVPILTCDQPGTAQHIDLEVRDDFHLLTIRAHNGGGKAGVLATVIPVGADGLYEEPLRRSGGGWKALAYPTRSFRLNPAQVMDRLLLEARRRGVANMDQWRFDFNATYDSAGRAWPAGDVITAAVGATMLDVLNQLATSVVDYAAAPAGRVLRMWVKDRGTGHTVAPPWTEGVDLTGRATTKALR